jgi:hypothetical protein
MRTYVNHITGTTYMGDKLAPEDYDVSENLPPLDGKAYKYDPENNTWSIDDDVQWLLIRKERDDIINNYMWKIERQSHHIALGKASSDSINEMLNYVQALRDVPQTQTDPHNIVWPTPPTI